MSFASPRFLRRPFWGAAVKNIPKLHIIHSVWWLGRGAWKYSGVVLGRIMYFLCVPDVRIWGEFGLFWGDYH